MANLKILKNRIGSVKSTQKMTKAMKVVAASRLKKAKKAVELSRPYTDKLEEVIINVASNILSKENFMTKFPLLVGNGKDNSYLLLVFSSDRGLCGGLNSSVVKMVKRRIQELELKGKEVKLFCVGKKAFDQLQSKYKDKIIGFEFGIFKDNITIDVARGVATRIYNLFLNKNFDICEIIFSKFKSAIAQEQICKQIIPAQINVHKVYNFDKNNNYLPINYTPDKDLLLFDLLPENLSVQIYNNLLESSASEQGARMAAMESATNNASKMIKNLTLVYNRTRQANITKELIDIISGASVV